MEPSEGMGKHYRLQQNPSPKHEHVLCLTQVEFANATYEQVAYDKVKETP